MGTRLASLSGMAAMAVATHAHALPAGVPYQATLDGSPVGSLRFELESQLAAGACRYDAEWNAGGRIFAGQCTLDEATWLGHGSCLENASAPLTSLVVLAPGQDCQGFDGTGQANPVFMVILGEAGASGALQGLLQFSAATPIVSSFHAVPAA